MGESTGAGQGVVRFDYEPGSLTIVAERDEMTMPPKAAELLEAISGRSQSNGGLARRRA